MRKLMLLISVAALLLVCSQSYAISSGTLTSTVVKQWGLSVVTLDWTSADDGVSSNTTKSFQGLLVRAVFVPDSGTAPSDDWDCTLLDRDGVDVLMGLGANHDTANAESVYFNPNASSSFTPVTVNTLNKFYDVIVPVFGVHRLYVTNAGDTKKGRIRLYLIDP